MQQIVAQVEGEGLREDEAVLDSVAHWLSQARARGFLCQAGSDPGHLNRDHRPTRIRRRA